MENISENRTFASTCVLQALGFARKVYFSGDIFRVHLLSFEVYENDAVPKIKKATFHFFVGLQFQGTRGESLFLLKPFNVRQL